MEGEEVSERGIEGLERKRSAMETENCGSLNADLWTLNFARLREAQRERDAGYHWF